MVDPQVSSPQEELPSLWPRLGCWAQVPRVSAWPAFVMSRDQPWPCNFFSVPGPLLHAAPTVMLSFISKYNLISWLLLLLLLLFQLFGSERYANLIKFRKPMNEKAKERPYTFLIPQFMLLASDSAGVQSTCHSNLVGQAGRQGLACPLQHLSEVVDETEERKETGPICWFFLTILFLFL